MNDPLTTLDGVLDHVWDRLAGAAANADDLLRTVCLATAGPGGPEARMVALRRADREAAEVEMHSDLRTAKVVALGADPRAAVLAWDPEARLQIRLTLVTRLLAADADRWARIPPAARTNYGTDPAPGTPVSAPERVTRDPEIGRFVAIIGQLRAIDVVSLAHEPHRRAVFDARGGRWVAP